MAVRLSVIMVHTPPASAASSELAESVVGQLIGLPEIDLTLIGPLARLSEGSTDRLSLDSITGDVALLDWQPAQSSCDALRQLGIEGERSAHEHDPDPPNQSAPTRRIYGFDLNRFSTADEVCTAITKLKDRRQIRTFSLSPGVASGLPVVRDSSSGSSAIPSDSASSTAPQDRPPVASSARPPVAKPTPKSEASQGTGPPAGGDLDLDQLLDQLDEIDP